MGQSRANKKFFHMAYSIGASIVILGALFKILHMNIGPINGDMLLMIGLFTEAGIFFISAFEPIDEDLDWSKVYPELGGGKREEKRKDRIQAKEAQTMLSQKLDSMLKDAKLDAGLMTSLGESIQSFKGAAEQIQPAVDSISATNRYSEQLSMAAAQMESLNSLYKVQLENTSRQAQVNEEMVKSEGLLKEKRESTEVESIAATNRYSEQISMAALQMESLNSVYKVQLESTSRQAQVNEEMAQNAAMLKEQMESMAANLQNLNGVYGGMLSAMNKG